MVILRHSLTVTLAGNDRSPYSTIKTSNSKHKRNSSLNYLLLDTLWNLFKPKIVLVIQGERGFIYDKSDFSCYVTYIKGNGKSFKMYYNFHYFLRFFYSFYFSLYSQIEHEFWVNKETTTSN